MNRDPGQDKAAVTRLDLKSVDARLTEMKQADAGRWNKFEARVHAATARLRKRMDKALSA